MMTKAELVEALDEIAARKNCDPEVNHSDADAALLRYINNAAVSEAFHSIEKWYA